MTDHDPDFRRNAPRNLTEWMGFRVPPDWSRGRRFGGALGWFLMAATIVLCPAAIVATGAVLLHTADIAFSGTTEGIDLGAGALIVALLGAPFLIWRTVIAQGNLEVVREGQITDRISKAVEQLGAERTVKVDGAKEERTEANIEVRIGGILALERIAQDSVRFHQGRDHVRIMELLCAYIRNNAPALGARDHGFGVWQAPTSKAPAEEIRAALEGIATRREAIRTWARALPAPRLDIAVALDVIGRRTAEQLRIEAAWPDPPGSTTEWPFAIPCPTRPEGAVEERQEREYRDRVAAWKRAMRRYKGYRLDLRGTNLQGSELSGKQLGGAQMDDARLEGSFGEGIQFQGARLRRVRMERVQFISKISNKSNMTFTDLTGSNLEAAEFRNVNVSNLRAHPFRNPVFVGVFFTGVNFSGTRLRRSSFDRCYFGACRFDDQTILNNATLFGADLSASNLPPSILEKAHGDDSTRLPEGMARPAHWGTSAGPLPPAAP